MELSTIVNRIISENEPATIEEAVELSRQYTIDQLADAADRIREACCGGQLDTCSIINARSGRCSEDCKFCAQSRHFPTGVKEYDIVDEEATMELARDCARRGVLHFSLVTSGRRVTEQQVDRFCAIYRRIRTELPQLRLCASMGLVSREVLDALYQAGVRRYHCNLETSSDYFPTLCSTHTHADKLRVIRDASEAGMEVCSGGIIGMGESLAQRLRLVSESYRAGAISIPVNILNPIPGTPLEHAAPLTDDDIILSVALMRFVAPKAVMRFAGGRARLSRATTERILRGGMNGVMVGDLLTTVGNSVDDDFKMFAETGYRL
ncbi:MAG: biotin synthase BioB [Bacteroides sp.]|nr:biotin synthase BioB [Bacteroides sp.]MCM1413513.1 biotin synthase BioB [Bacteroides sp.]MCM1471067.1 biotin synthase BioB [Bacteroides sp.]